MRGMPFKMFCGMFKAACNERAANLTLSMHVTMQRIGDTLLSLYVASNGAFELVEMRPEYEYEGPYMSGKVLFDHDASDEELDAWLEEDEILRCRSAPAASKGRASL